MILSKEAINEIFVYNVNAKAVIIEKCITDINAKSMNNDLRRIVALGTKLDYNDYNDVTAYLDRKGLLLQYVELHRKYNKLLPK